MSRNSSILAAGVAVLLAAALFAGGPLGVAARTLMMVPFALFVPGYAIVAACALPSFGRAERLTVAIGLSLALGVLVGLALHLTPWGVRPVAWMGSLLAVTLVAGGIALRRGALAPPQRPSGRQLSLPQAICGGAALVIVVAALGVALVGQRNEPETGFTELWAVPTNAAEPNNVRLGIDNRESGTVRYRLLLTAGASDIQEWSTLTLAPGDEWETTVALPANLPPDERVELTLYRADSPTVIYRRVQLGRGAQ